MLVQAEITIDRKRLIAAGHPPFMVLSAVEAMVEPSQWIVTGRDRGNCVAHPDGVRAVFDDEQCAITLCQELNHRGAS